MGGVAAGAEDDGVDHYAVLGLPSGEEGAVLTLKEIEKAYKSESRRRHPDKRPDDPDATADFQRLKASYAVLKPRRAAFDARLRARRDRALRDFALDSRRRKLAADLEERERAAAEGGPVDPAAEAARREKKVAADLKRELDEFKARKSKKARSTSAEADSAKTSGQGNREENEGVALDKEKMLRVSWEKGLGDYGAAELREIFRRFGVVEDVVIRSKGSRKKSKGNAIVVMSSKDAAKKSAQNKAIRSKQRHMHSMGPKSFARIRRKLEKETEQPLSQAFFIETRKRKGKPLDQEMNQIIEQLKSLQSQQSQGEESIDPFSAVMGEERPGRVRLYGRGVTQTLLKGKEASGSSLVVPEELLSSLRAKVEEDVKKSLQREFDIQKAEFAKSMTAIVTQLKQSLPTIELNEEIFDAFMTMGRSPGTDISKIASSAGMHEPNLKDGDDKEEEINT